MWPGLELTAEDEEYQPLWRLLLPRLPKILGPIHHDSPCSDFGMHQSRSFRQRHASRLPRMCHQCLPFLQVSLPRGWFCMWHVNDKTKNLAPAIITTAPTGELEDPEPPPLRRRRSKFRSFVRQKPNPK